MAPSAERDDEAAEPLETRFCMLSVSRTQRGEGGSDLSVYCGEDGLWRALGQSFSYCWSAWDRGSGCAENRAEQREACYVRWPLIAVPTQRTFSRASRRHRVDIAEVRPLSAAIDGRRLQSDAQLSRCQSVPREHAAALCVPEDGLDMRTSSKVVVALRDDLGNWHSCCVDSSHCPSSVMNSDSLSYSRWIESVGRQGVDARLARRASAPPRQCRRHQPRRRQRHTSTTPDPTSTAQRCIGQDGSC